MPRQRLDIPPGITTCDARSTWPSVRCSSNLRRRERRNGVTDGRSGAVVVVQGFGGALNLNIHLHALVLDGVFTNDGGRVRFHPVRRLTREDVAEVLAMIVRRVTRRIDRRGLAGRARPGRSGDRRRVDAADGAPSGEPDGDGSREPGPEGIIRPLI